MEKIKIAIIDDQTLFRESMALLIQSQKNFDLLYTAASGEDFLSQISAAALPDIALVDMAMAGMNGVELSQLMKKDYPEIKVIILSVYDQERYIYKTITSGASAYLTKTCGKRVFIEAITAVHQTGFYMTPEVLKAIRNADEYANKSLKTINSMPVELTRREAEILKLICQEYSNQEIAERLFLSIRTVEGHRNNMLLKTGCHNTAGLVSFAIRNHIHDPHF